MCVCDLSELRQRSATDTDCARVTTSAMVYVTPGCHRTGAQKKATHLGRPRGRSVCALELALIPPGEGDISVSGGGLVHEARIRRAKHEARNHVVGVGGRGGVHTVLLLQMLQG